MNLTNEEKKELVQAYVNNDKENLYKLFGKARGVCPTCISNSYIKQWMEYWFAVKILKKSTDVS